ncbi:hypothetical protein [Comamonas testosteroni]|uniref:hypothetical protein n=1 Tax=Comamonas testosteroni TaxID=285 RepID=UPI0015FDBB7D|nr:hypothetical protein [Comamonas testosteroni]
MNYDNPAGRLLEILLKVKTYSKGTAAREVWQSVLGLPPSEILSPLMNAKIATVMSLVHQALELLREEHPELAESTPGWATQVCTAFQLQNLHGTINEFTSQISNETISNVRMTAVLLDKGSRRKTLSSDELAEMRDSINSVLDEVLKSAELDSEIRAYLARALRKILTAIEDFQLTGAAPILESIEQAVGHVMVDPEYKNFLINNQLGQRVLDAFQAASCIVTVAVGMPALTQAAQLFLR